MKLQYSFPPPKDDDPDVYDKQSAAEIYVVVDDFPKEESHPIANH